MAKPKPLIDELMALPPVARSNNWFSRLPQEVQSEIRGAALAWASGGPLRERFSKKVDLAKAIISRRDLKVHPNRFVEKITELIDGAH